MKKALNIRSTEKVAILLLIFASFGLLACTMVGNVVPLQNRILFNEKSVNQGTYNDGELTLNYSYNLVGRHMTLDGEITSVWKFDSIDVSLLFFDTNGTVLQETIVYYSGYREENPSTSTDTTFKTILVVPRGAVGMSFSMTDTSREGKQI